jgi:DNA polymerase III subunit delta
VLLQRIVDLENELSKGIEKVYLILGPEEYQCRSAVSLLKSTLLNQDSYAFDYSEFTTGEVSMDQIIEAVNTFPMISKKRVVLVNQVEKLKEAEQNQLLDTLDDFSPRSVIILIAGELDHRKKFYKTLRDRVCVAEFPKLKGIALEQWAQSYVHQQGLRISPSAIKKLVDLAGTDLQSLATELEKLLLYTGNAKSIPDSAVDELVRESRQQSIFDLIGAIGRRDRNAALRNLANLLSMGEHPLVVVSMMARHCRQVLIAKECMVQGQDARGTGTAAQIPPFILEQFLRQARTVDADSIQRIFLRLAEVDKKLKSSSVDGRILIEHIICAFV